VVERSSRAFDLLAILRIIGRDVESRDASAAMGHPFRARLVVTGDQLATFVRPNSFVFAPQTPMRSRNCSILRRAAFRRGPAVHRCSLATSFRSSSS
jgi:hypothetical protein